MAHKKALIVGVEGLPGCGKTTAVALIIKDLAAQGLRVYAVDINTAASAPELRAYADAYPITDPRHMMPIWILRIRQHEAIHAIRGDMDVILSDRSWWSAIAFDCYGNGVARKFLGAITEKLTMPDIVLLLHAPLSVLCERKRESRTMHDLAFARRVARGYRALARIHGWHMIDATRTQEQVKEHCLAIIRTASAARHTDHK